MSGLNDMFDAYVACALWSSTDESRDDGGDPLDKNYSKDDIAEETLATMRADVESFWNAHHEAIGVEFEDAGHDLWLTRNGHGAGFWDGDWTEPHATTLTNAANALGEVNLYVGDDGKIYGA